jgi:hypothetical protein
VRPAAEDIGREQVTGFAPDRGAFRVPSLRNAGLRAPFFHNGGKQTMLDVVLFYQIGGDFPNQATLDPRLVPVPMTHSERVAVADFVQNALTDPRVTFEQFPFDRPTLRSELASYLSDFGIAKSGVGGFVPRHVASTEPYIGNAQFRVGLSGAVGGAPAYFVMADTPGSRDPRSTPCPSTSIPRVRSSSRCRRPFRAPTAFPGRGTRRSASRFPSIPRSTT